MKILIDIPENEYKRIKKYCEEHNTVETVYARIWSGKVVEEQDRPIGHWIKTEYHRWRCSVCREKGMSEWDNIHDVRTNFCPDCGAKMDSQQSS